MSDAKIQSQEQVAVDWLRITLERFQKAMDKTGVSKERKGLFDSFVSSVEKGGDAMVKRALIHFRFYGRFVDMGVGRGVPIGSQKAKVDFLKSRNSKGQLHKYGRKPKKWYSRTLAGQTKKLSELLQTHYAIGAIQVIEGSLDKGDLDIKF